MCWLAVLNSNRVGTQMQQDVPSGTSIFDALRLVEIEADVTKPSAPAPFAGTTPAAVSETLGEREHGARSTESGTFFFLIGSDCIVFYGLPALIAADIPAAASDESEDTVGTLPPTHQRISSAVARRMHWRPMTPIAEVCAESLDIAWYASQFSP